MQFVSCRNNGSVAGMRGNRLDHSGFLNTPAVRSTNERVVIVEEQKCRNIYVMHTFVTSYLVDSNLSFLSRNASLSIRLFLVV